MRSPKTRRSRALVVVGALAAASLAMPLAAAGASSANDDNADTALPKLGKPIDKQRWENPDDMRWSDYVAVPGTDWANVDLAPTVRTFKIAVVLGDFTDQPFLVTQDKKSHPFGNPQKVFNLPEDEVAQFYEDFLNTPNKYNHGHTVNEYWMEDTYGEYGVDLTAFGVYHLPGKLHEYGLADFQGGQGCPAGDTCNKDIRSHLGSAWIADVGQEVADEYELIYYLTAGHDESGTWQEFGEMKFQNQDAVTDEFGPPDDSLPNWVRTRYIPWTSWLAGANHWPNAGGGSSTQAESSGAGVYAHELSHLFGIGDNYNNPYGVPVSRSYSGPWDMMSRGSFNGPYGPHMRWVVPATKSATMGAQHMLRNKIKLGVIKADQYLSVTRGGLANSGLVMLDVTARAVEVEGDSGRDGQTGINIQLDGGDHSPACDPSQQFDCDRGNYSNYTVEVVDRMGTDSFTPDSGVLMAKTKNVDSAPFVWVIDANRDDIDVVDFKRPDGTKAMISLGDYRQLSDALFHAGTKSGSKFEYVDEANNLHFYILDKYRDDDGVLHYSVAVQSLAGDGPHTRGVEVSKGLLADSELINGIDGADGFDAVTATCTFEVTNTGKAKDVSGSQPEDVSDYVDNDVFKLSAKAPAGTKIWLPRKVIGVENGDTATVEVKVAKKAGDAAKKLTLKVKSVSDGSAKGKASCKV